MGVDVNDTSRCPVAPACAGCGSTESARFVAVADTPVGVLCLTLCPGCFKTGQVPQLDSWLAAFEAVAAHCEHLGIDLDQMAAALQAERQRHRVGGGEDR